MTPNLTPSQRLEFGFRQMHEVQARFVESGGLLKVEQCAEVLVRALQNGNKIITCGNGGSMCDAMHFAEELSGRFRGDRPALPAVAISDPGFLSCAANDYGYDHVFARWLEAFGQPGDVLVAISTSGNSRNVVWAANTAQSRQMIVIGLTGKDGGKLAKLCDLEIRIPHYDYADRIQELHIKVIHSLIELIENAIYPHDAR
jgi:D-sedoheptulose 7-phosphate isomerase